MALYDHYHPGDYFVRCDRTGFKVLASECRMTWDGYFVRKESWDERHPQQFVKGRKDDQTVPIPRPAGTDYFLSTNEVTADSL